MLSFPLQKNMDLEEWEFLSNDGSFLVDFHDHISGRRKENRFFSTPNSAINMEHFICPAPPQPCSLNMIKPTLEKAREQEKAQDLEHVPIILDSAWVPEKAQDLEHVPLILDSASVPEKAQDLDFLEKIKGPVVLLDGDQENDHYQVSFKKVKENEFVDMKLDSPKSKHSKGLTLQVGPVKYQFDHIGDTTTTTKKQFSPKIRQEADTDSNWDDDKQEGFNIWKWSLNGVGTLCSISVAAATICILIFGKTQGNHNKKLNFQIFTDDKGMKNMVGHAGKLNESISAPRGAQLSRANITFGGHINVI